MGVYQLFESGVMDGDGLRSAIALPKQIPFNAPTTAGQGRLPPGAQL
ncbi:MAG TPA: hypothetical protein V6D06_17185 [Trichocoleus sp.]